MKEPDYFMKIMAAWMTLHKLEGTNNRRKRKDENGALVAKCFVYY